MTDAPIVVVGGFMSWARSYRELACTLGEISGAEVHVAKITPLDWFLARFKGYGQIVFEVASTVDKALLESDSKKAILVGHSAGGVVCRVYIGGDPPYGGRRYSGHRRVSTLITLGSPHIVPEGKSLAPINRVNSLFPGALHESINYLSVAGAAVSGASSKRARKIYERLAPDGHILGDGVVPVEAALLPGSEHLVLDALHHSRRLGKWYGSDREAVEKWWPTSLRARDELVEERRA